jgi:hypothetical protein
MGFHSFSLDPRTVLGVGPGASLEEIREAYRAKSKKHHPDVGGDEWAFRMVARAYEVLKTTAEAPASATARPWEGRGAGRDDAAERASAAATEAVEPGPEEAGEPQGAGVDPARIRTVDVELIWTRFEKDGPARLLAERDADDSTLSVCIVMSWPEAGLVERISEFAGAAEILHTLIDLFERLRKQEVVVAARSRIEDGRFVGWLSYPDVLTAQDAVLAVRDTFRTRGLAIKLQTRDERIPFDWHSESHAPVMSQAS